MLNRSRVVSSFPFQSAWYDMAYIRGVDSVLSFGDGKG